MKLTVDGKKVKLATPASRSSGKKSKKPKKARPANSPSALRRFSPSAAAYATALGNPFSDNAVGAKVPDLYSGHTDTYRLWSSITVAPSGTSGSVVILPNLACYAVSPSGSISGGSTITWGDGTTTLTALMGFNTNTLFGKVTNYRIVGMGVRIVPTASMTNAQGKITVATHPISSWAKLGNFTVGGQSNVANSNATASNTLLTWGVPNSSGTVSGSNIAGLLDSKVYSVLDAAQEPIEIVPKLCDPAAFEFRESVDSYLGFMMADQSAAGADVWGGDPSYLRLNGFEAVDIAFEGLPNGAGSFDVDICFHIEGSPNMTGALSAGAFSATTKASPVDPMGMWEAIAMIAKSPTVRQSAKAGAQYIHPVLGQLARAVL